MRQVSFVSLVFISFWLICDIKKLWFLYCFADVSASMKQLLAIMHGPGTIGILPPERGMMEQDSV